MTEYTPHRKAIFPTERGYQERKVNIYIKGNFIISNGIFGISFSGGLRIPGAILTPRGLILEVFRGVIKGRRKKNKHEVQGNMRQK